jgi:hypothetical protein
LGTISLATGSKPASATVELNGKTLAAETIFTNGTCTLKLSKAVMLAAGETVSVFLK